MAWIPTGQVHSRAVLESVADRVQHIGLNPKRVTSLAGPDAQTSLGDSGLASGSLRDDSASRMWVHSFRASDRPHDVALLLVDVTLVKGKAIGYIFDGIAIEIDLEFVHSFRMVARRGNGTEN